MKRPAATNKSLPVNKALTILPLEKGGLGMMELSKWIGLNRSTAYRLVSALMESGFIRQEPVTRKYFFDSGATDGVRNLPEIMKGED